MSMVIWLRAETKANEHRTPLTPSDAAKLVDSGFQLFVEESEQRTFPDSAYAAAGCRLVATSSWTEAPDDACILGIKELPEDGGPLRHRHIYFGHAYKDQPGWQALLRRFLAGGGALLDLEYLVDDTGQRVAAFGYWAGFAGAALGVRQWAGRQREGNDFSMTPQRPVADQQELVAAIRNRMELIPEPRTCIPRAIVVGALGRCGRGAVSLFEALGIAVDQWDVEETASGGPFPALLDYDIMVNTVLLGASIPPFLTDRELDQALRRLSVIADVSCDPGNPGNPLPIYTEVTDFRCPALRIRQGDNPLDVIAVDHLPSLLPRESSIDFSNQLLPHLLTLTDQSPVWERCERKFREVSRSLT